MSNHTNVVCKNCGNFFTAYAYDDGTTLQRECGKCKPASSVNGKLIGTVALVVVGILAAGIAMLLSKSENKKQTAITIALIFTSVFIFSKWGFIWFVVFVALCFGWKYYKKNQLPKNIELNKTDDIVQDDVSSK